MSSAVNSRQNIKFKNMISNTDQSEALVKTDVSGSDFLDNVKTSDEFLQFIKDNKITYKKLKEVVFGNKAIEVIGYCKNYGQEYFDVLLQSHSAWYNAKYAIKKLVE